MIDIETRIKLQDKVIFIFKSWNVRSLDQFVILDLYGVHLDRVHNYMKGVLVFNDYKTIEIGFFLLDIDCCLEMFGMISEEKKSKWIHSPNGKFEWAKPIDILMSGMEGVEEVRERLVKTFKVESFEKKKCQYFKKIDLDLSISQ